MCKRRGGMSGQGRYLQGFNLHALSKPFSLPTTSPTHLYPSHTLNYQSHTHQFRSCHAHPLSPIKQRLHLNSPQMSSPTSLTPQMTPPPPSLATPSLTTPLLPPKCHTSHSLATPPPPLRCHASLFLATPSNTGSSRISPPPLRGWGRRV